MWQIWIAETVLSLTFCAGVIASEAASRPADAPVIDVATCQFEVTRDITANAEAIRSQMRAARAQGASVAHFCECALSGYPGADLDSLEDFDWDLLRAETRSIVELAGKLRIWVILGSIHRLSPGHKPHNSVYVMSAEGRIVDRYDKRFCTTRDLQFFTPGDHFTTFLIDGVKCGVLICFDLGYPELFREYARQEVRVIFHSYYNARGQRYHVERARMTRAMAAGHAAMNFFYLSQSNTSGPLSWGSFVVAPDAEVMNSLPDLQPGVMVTRIDLQQPRYDFTRPFRRQTLAGRLHSGETVVDERSADRSSY